MPPDFQPPLALHTQSSCAMSPSSSTATHPHAVVTPTLSSEMFSASQDKDGTDRAAVTETNLAEQRKRPMKDSEGENNQAPSQKRFNPYGVWTTVTLRCVLDACCCVCVCVMSLMDIVFFQQATGACCQGV